MRVRLAYRGALLTLTLSLLSCGGDDGGTGVDAYLPTLPATGGAATVLVRQITEATAAQDLIDGEARGGLIGDYVMKNDKISVVVQRPNRSISQSPTNVNTRLLTPIPADWSRAAFSPRPVISKMRGAK